MLLYLSVLFVAFCGFNAILQGSTNTYERIRIFFGLYSDYSWSLRNPGRNKYQCLGSGMSNAVIFHEIVHIRLSGDTKVYAQTDILLFGLDRS
jgi:hypothetical protein